MVYNCQVRSGFTKPKKMAIDHIYFNVWERKYCRTHVSRGMKCGPGGLHCRQWVTSPANATPKYSAEHAGIRNATCYVKQAWQYVTVENGLRRAKGNSLFNLLLGREESKIARS
jgi:hypothetical protein